MDGIRGSSTVDVEARRALHKVLQSSYFSGAPRVSEFLRFAAEAALEGRDHIDQHEIARRILGKNQFNPVDDPAVRKLATATRQRLALYYGQEGAADSIVIELPLRSYVTSFRQGVEVREKESAKPPPAEIERRPSPRKARFVLSVLAAIAILVLGGWWLGHRASASVREGYFVIAASEGSLNGPRNDVAPEAIRLGPKVGPDDQVTVRLEFTPEHPVQQAGLLIFENADHYVKLGRIFNQRSFIDFSMEVNAKWHWSPKSFTYDPRGQSKRPVWLGIRRKDSVFRAFVSDDGATWETVGEVLTMPAAMPNARVGIFSYKGRSSAPAIEAAFHGLSHGPHFPAWTDTFTEPPEGWRESAQNCTATTSAWLPKYFGLTPPESVDPCDWTFSRTLPSGEWSLGTKMDFQAQGRGTAGLFIRGRNGTIRLFREALNHASLVAQKFTQSGGNQRVDVPDFPGAPPVVMRLYALAGRLRADVSRDEIETVPIPLGVSVQELGDPIEGGLFFSRGPWFKSSDTVPVRFETLQYPILTLGNYRSK